MPMRMQVTQAAAQLWADPDSRAKIVEMHGRGVSLLDMVRELGLDTALDADGLRSVIEGLSPAEVEVIRAAFTADPAGGAFPVDCGVDDPSAGVRVVAGDGEGVSPIARIEPAG